MLRTIRFILLTACVALSASAASALTISSASLGGDKGCTTLACTTVTHTFGAAIGSGGGTLDLTGGLLTFVISGVGGSFNPGVSFTDMVYTGTANVSEVVPGLYTVTSGSAMIDGEFVVGPFSTNAITVGGSCTDSGSALNCGLIFSFEAPDANFYFHTVNLTVPEPALTGLLGLALVGGAALFRRR